MKRLTAICMMILCLVSFSSLAEDLSESLFPAVGGNGKWGYMDRVAEGEHGAPYRPAKMKNGIFRKSFEYGPDSVEGVIRKEDILKVWPDAPLENDWPFSVNFYNTSTGRAFRMFLDISFDAETGRAEAVFYVYYPGYAKPTTDRWEGKPGEKVSVLLEI